MKERSARTLLCAGCLSWRRLSGLALVLLLGAGCVGRHAGARTLASIGALAVGAGSVSWAAGEGLDGGTHGSTSRALTGTGFVAVAVGLAAIVAAGGWMAATVSCDADPDCPEEETCREVPAPPGGVPYKQCVPRG
ncbi:MAG TPA: hypothetical protein VGP64_01670 [Polyangia bacterium]|jgi:hypothetical protein